ncbi:DnaJ domain-containing protein [Rubrobacter marinus]|uniref:DnaJ domain-containing protein n=1 Tax=Rubrobacter marinus TaxID=2653852 RepID=A0A6G8PRV5_9ACTN|nr:J domain-containing protein [Rubrobacter marinus]QIN77218.1 DnaJ domain-containing protein [Rubrobacter marinus]
MAEQINYYRILGVPRSASQSEIKAAYRRLAKERHPDHSGGSETEFSQLQEANAVLSDPNRRRRHDEALDLAHAADQLAGLNLDFGSLDDEVSRKRREREERGTSEGGPSLGERLRNRFRKEEPEEPSARRSEPSSGRGRYRGAPAREASWYQPQDFDPEPITWRSGALSFFGALIAFLVVGQIGLWATGLNNPPAVLDPGVTALGPLMFVPYTLVGLLAAYLAYRAAGWAALALVFVAALVVGGSGGPDGLLQFVTLGIVLLLIVVYLGNRRDERSRRR